MLDIALAWGLTTGAGTLLKPVVEELVTDATKDWFKDMFKGSLSNVLKLPQKEPLEKCAKKAIGQFLNEFTEQLQDAELDDPQVKEYVKPLKKFLKIKQVRETLGNPLQPEVKTLNIQLLDKLWQTDNLQELPDDFDWSGLGKRYVRKVKKIIKEDEELRQIFDSENLARLAEGKEITTDFSLRKYRETIQERYQNLPLDGLDHSIQDRRLPLWDVFIMQNVRKCQEYLPTIYELPKEYQDKLRRHKLPHKSKPSEYKIVKREELEHFDYSEVSRSLLEVIEKENKDNYLVILGDPGSGKSTLLKYLALKWTQLPLKELTVKPIPLLIELRDYARSLANKDCANFLEFIHKSPNWVGHLNQHELNENLNRGHALVMFDGLDEVFDLQQRETIITQIHDLTQDYPQIQVIVTSRVIGYEHQTLKNANFDCYMIQDFDEIQIEKFSEKWHSLIIDNPQDKYEYQQKLKKGIANSRAIGELAGNPLLLTMMAILNRSQELPRDRIELYEKCSEILLYRLDYDKKLTKDEQLNYKTLTYRHKVRICWQIAYFMQLDKTGLEGNIISEENLENILFDYFQSQVFSHSREITILMIHQLRHRNFILCSLGVIGQEEHFGFVHRTFLEYFCACRFVWQFEKDKTLSLEDLKTQVFGKHWQDETWHEVLKLICSMIEPKFAGEIIKYLMSLDGKEEFFTNLLLGADCLSEVRNRKKIQEVDQKLLMKIKSRHFHSYIEVHESLDSQKNSDIKALLAIQMILKLTEKILIVWKDIEYLEKIALSCENLLIKISAIIYLKKHFPNNTFTLKILQNAIDDEYEDIRHIGIEGLAENFQNHHDTFRLIKNSASHKSSQTRFVAVEQLGKYYYTHPDTLKILEITVLDEDKGIRKVALQYLVELFPNRPQLKELLQDRLENDPDEEVRKYVESIIDKI